MPISVDYERFFSQLLRRRGEHYVRDSRVHLSAADGGRLTATVRCSQDFTVEIDLNAPSGLHARCDCDYFQGRGVCKHVWAVLLEADRQCTEQSSPAAAPSTPEIPAASNTNTGDGPQILYLLDLDQDGDTPDNVQLFCRVRDEAGGWRAPRPLRLKRSEVKELGNALDRHLLGLLFGIPTESYPEDFDGDGIPHRVECSSFRVNDGNCRCWLRLLSATERFHLVSGGRMGPPVTWEAGDPWRLGLGFAETDRGFRVEGFLERDQTRVGLREVQLVLPRGVAVLENQAFLLDTSGAESWLGKVLPEPYEGSREDWLPTLREVVESDPGPLLQLPTSWSWSEETREPQPVLVLRLQEGGRVRREFIPARMFYDYDGRRVAESDAIQRLCHEETKEVRPRNTEAERSLRQSLLATGVSLVDAPSGNFDYRVPGESFAQLINGLLADGWVVESRDRRYRGGGELQISVNTGIDWFELTGSLQVGGETVSLPDVLRAARQGDPFVTLSDGSAGMLPESWLQRVAMLTSMGQTEDTGVKFHQAQGWILDALLAERSEVNFDAGFERFREQLSAFRGISAESENDTFSGSLREYQREALGWFRFLREFGLSGCLADDMGLGKTVQVLALLDKQRFEESRRGPTLVVAPRSVVYNWVQESERFVPGLRVLEYGGPQRHNDRDRFDEYDLIVTSYGVLRRDALHLEKQQFYYVILDEAQSIKNPNSKTAKCARVLRSQHRLALTGTPIENHVFDLWSLFEFLNPGMLGSSSAFQGFLGLGRNANPRAAERDSLARALRPFLLRRTKEQVAQELPPRTEQTLFCAMDSEQRAQYDELLGYYRNSLLQRIENDGMGSSRMHVLEALLRLRQVACHPRLVDPAYGSGSSCKLDQLIPQLQEISQEGHKTLVFSQFTRFLGLLRERLDTEGMTYEYLDGKTRDRQAPVERFQTDPDCPLFLISLKAGGLGLNLTAAEYVFILDPWWNPAVEAQAIDRAHRIGQTRQVFAYRLICRDTVEEKILQLQQQKRELADAIVRADGSLLQNLTRDDLELLLS